MSGNEIRPAQAHRSIMFIILGIVFVLFTISDLPLILFLPDAEAQLVFTIIVLVGWAVMLSIAFWIPAFYRSLEYAVDDDAVRMNCGVFWKRQVTVPYQKITNVDITQGPLQRMYSLGTVHIQTAGAGGAEGNRAEIRFTGVRDTNGIRDRVLENMRGDRAVSAESRPVPGIGSDTGSAVILKDILVELRAIHNHLTDSRP